MDVINRSKQMTIEANSILEELGLKRKWSVLGEVYIVGAMSYDLMVNPDIDVEIFSDAPRPSQALNMLHDLAEHPRIVEIKYKNHHNTPFNGFYFKITYESETRTIWNIDMWLFHSKRQGPVSRNLVDSMNASLTNDSRRLILMIKEDMIRKNLNYPSIFIYQAVLNRDIQHVEEFYDWVKTINPDVLTDWTPQ